MKIKVENIFITLKGQKILENVTFAIDAKECVGLIGHNGSGKSVLLKAICGFLPYEGEIIVAENQIIPGKKFIQNAGIMIEQPEMIGYLTALQNLQLLADIKKQISEDKIKKTLELVGLIDVGKKHVKNFSLGMKQRLRIAQALMEDPDVLILDEPFNGLDKSGVQEILELLEKLKLKNKTILLTSHDERHIEFLCDRVYEIEGQRLVCQK